jgi:formylglycine-generating enzyme
MTGNVTAAMRSRLCALSLSLCGFFLATCLIVPGSALSNENVVRIQDTPPASGKFVRSDRGYMVAYDQAIPGTHETIRMIPVPGGVIEIQPPIERDAVDDAVTLESAKPLTRETTKIELQPFWVSETEITMKQLMPYRQLYYRIKKKHPDEDADPIEFGHVDGVTGPTDVYAPDVHFEYATELDAAAPSGSQYMARQYTKWLSLLTKHEYRLPMRSEWQHACRALSHEEQAATKQATEKQATIDTASHLDRHAVYAANATAKPSLLVRRKSPNAWGLFDMQGNAAEWVIEDTARTGLQYGHVAMGGHLRSDAEDCQCDSMIRSSLSWWDVDPDFPRSPWWTTSGDGLMTGFRIIAPFVPMSNEGKQIAWEPDSKELFDDVKARIEQGRGTYGLAQ